MRKFIIVLLAVIMGYSAAKSQTIEQIRKIYGEAKESVAGNGNNGEDPLDITMTLRGGSNDGGDITEEISTISFYFNKYRTDPSLDFPDASSCYLATEKWSVNGNSTYREILFDPNDGYLLFSYMRGETDAGFVVESRYYYGSGGKLIDQKHKIGGEEATANAHTWSSAEGDRELADKYLAIFNALMNSKATPTNNTAANSGKGNPSRMKYIRDTYATAKQKADKNSKSELPLDLSITIHDQVSGPPRTTDMTFCYDKSASGQISSDVSKNYYCYLISSHSHNNMGTDDYSEYLFTPQSSSLIFSYNRSVEENEKYETRYYYDDRGMCIEAKTNGEEGDGGAADKKTAKRFVDLFYKICGVAIR